MSSADLLTFPITFQAKSLYWVVIHHVRLLCGDLFVDVKPWEVCQIKDVKLPIPEHYTFDASIRFFTALGIPSNYITLATLNESALFSGTYKTSFDTLSLQKSLSRDCNQVNRYENKKDGKT